MTLLDAFRAEEAREGPVSGEAIFLSGAALQALSVGVGDELTISIGRQARDVLPWRGLFLARQDEHCPVMGLGVSPVAARAAWANSAD